MARKNASEYLDTITQSCAHLLWCMAWADAMEEAGRSVQGEIFDQAPETPMEAYVCAGMIVARFEAANKTSIASIFYAAYLAATGEEPAHGDYHGDMAHRFGVCLAFQYVGSGVTWQDDYPAFQVHGKPFERARGEMPGALRSLAEDTVNSAE